MRWFKRIALTLVAIVVLLLGIGLILPSTFKVQRSIFEKRIGGQWGNGASLGRPWIGSWRPDFETGLKNLKALAERS